MATIGSRIREARDKAGISQRLLARDINVATTLVSHWEVGVRTPSFEDIMRVAKILDVPARELLDGVEDVTLRISDMDAIQLIQTFTEFDPFFRQRFLEFAYHFADIAREAKA